MQSSCLLPNALFPLLLILFLCGCSTVPRISPDAPPPIRSAPTDGVTLNETSDPFEGLNRGLYRCNSYLDDYLLLPLVKTYRFLLPDYVEERISSALDNIGDIGNLTNALLQFKGTKAGTSFGRLAINSTIGILGFWDPATRYFKLRRQQEDFGQTLGYHGLRPGPYLILPLFGPSNLRDTTGLATDAVTASALDPFNFNDSNMATPYYAVNTLDTRKREPFRYFGSGSPFEYELVRMIYTQRREREIAH